MKNNITLDPSNKLMAGLNKHKQQQRIQQQLKRCAKHTWYLELALAACLGAALALGFVVAHGMLTTQWTW